MRQRKFKPARRKTERRWRVPPALMHGDDVFEGLSVLDEVPGELGLVLWQSLRDATLWGTASEEERGALFAPGAETARVASVVATGVPAAVEPPLMVLARLVGHPGTMREENVALACREVAQWADEGGMLAAALAFSQAAAMVTPGDAGAAFAVGRLARRRAEYPRAESWYRRAIALARQSGDWFTYSMGFLGLGHLYSQRGNYPASQRFMERALRASQRNSLHTVTGQAYHQLFSLAVSGGRTEGAEDLARAALEALGPTNPTLPRLAHDVAYFWMTQGKFGPAITVFRTLLPLFRTSMERLICLADLARAAGGLGESETFRGAWDEAQGLLESSEAVEVSADALIEFAHGALSLSAWEVAGQASRRALDIATRRGEAKGRLTAEALLEAAEHHRAAADRIAATAAEPASTDSSYTLASEFVQNLNAYAGAA